MSAGEYGKVELAALLVDPHPVVREGCRLGLRGVHGIAVAGEAADAQGACDSPYWARADVVVYEFNSPGVNGPEAIRRMCGRAPSPRILLFSGCDEDGRIVAALQAGASGFLSKLRPVAELPGAILAVATGQMRIIHSRGAELLRLAIGRAPAGPLQQLSPRELQLYHLLAEGRGTADIAAALSISPKTVAVHRSSILRKLGLASVVQLARMAARDGLMDPG
jgi:DNA-binding NarL/FixJ family response regulator